MKLDFKLKFLEQLETLEPTDKQNLWSLFKEKPQSAALLHKVGPLDPFLMSFSSLCFCPRPPPSPSGTITAAYGQPQNHSIPVYEMKFPDLCVY